MLPSFSELSTSYDLLKHLENNLKIQKSHRAKERSVSIHRNIIVTKECVSERIDMALFTATQLKKKKPN